MAITLDTIPDNLQPPGVYIELDPSKAGTQRTTWRALLIAMAGGGLTRTTDTPHLITSLRECKEGFGNGTEISRMYEAFRRNDPFNQLWCMAVTLPGGYQYSTLTATVAGTATGSGTFNVYIFGRRIAVPVSTGETANQVASRLNTMINADPSLAVSSAVSGGIVTMTLKIFGGSHMTTAEAMQYIRKTRNDQETITGEPGGLTLTIAAGTQSASANEAAALRTALANIGTEGFDVVVWPYCNTDTLDEIRTAALDTTGWWSYANEQYGHAFTAFRGNAARGRVISNALNSQHISIMAFEDSISGPDIWAAAFAGVASASLQRDPARPLQTLIIEGVEGGKDYTISEKQIFLTDGMCTYNKVAGRATVTRAVTTYQTNQAGEPDDAYHDVNTLYTLSFIMRFIKARIASRFPRSKLASNGTRIGAGQDIVTPDIIRGEIIAAYRELIGAGVTEGLEAFQNGLIVERVVGFPNEVRIVFPPDLINQLRTVAIRTEFVLESTVT